MEALMAAAYWCPECEELIRPSLVRHYAGPNVRPYHNVENEQIRRVEHHLLEAIG